MRDLAEHIAGPERHEQRDHRYQPEREPYRRDDDGVARVRPGMRRRLLAEQAFGVGQAAFAVAVAGSDLKRRGARAGADIADQRGARDDDRERHVEEEDGDEGGGRERDHRVVLERALADADDRFQRRSPAPRP